MSSPIRQGQARRVVFFYPGEEGTYLDHCQVSVFSNGIVEVTSNEENTMCHIQNCEILWSYQPKKKEGKEPTVRLLRSKHHANETSDQPK